jgi:hypothetical protein
MSYLDRRGVRNGLYVLTCNHDAAPMLEVFILLVAISIVLRIIVWLYDSFHH